MSKITARFLSLLLLLALLLALIPAALAEEEQTESDANSQAFSDAVKKISGYNDAEVFRKNNVYQSDFLKYLRSLIGEAAPIVSIGDSTVSYEYCSVVLVTDLGIYVYYGKPYSKSIFFHYDLSMTPYNKNTSSEQSCAWDQQFAMYGHILDYMRNNGAAISAEYVAQCTLQSLQYDEAVAISGKSAIAVLSPDGKGLYMTELDPNNSSKFITAYKELS